MKLSENQQITLAAIATGPVDEFMMRARVGSGWRLALGALVRRDLATYHPYGAKGYGSWRITARGREVAKDMDLIVSDE